MAEDRRMLRLFTLDPLHIGVGQDIMGEVDLPVDRESETGVPRIPGTALKGGFRAHAAWKLKMDGDKTKPCPGDQPGEQEGEGGKDKGPLPRDHYCEITSCPICQTFGYPSLKTQEEQIAGHEGRVYFRDARLAFFPAATDKGMLWFSTPGRTAAWLDLEGRDQPEVIPELIGNGTEPLALRVNQDTSETRSELRVGWIHITGIAGATEDQQVQQVLDALRKSAKSADRRKFPAEDYWRHIIEHTVLLDETNFYRLVETCLERRTCNRVDQDTGTVAEGALFSYEALPRASLFCSRIYAEDFFGAGKIRNYASPLQVCELAREGFARMGIGGMQTRGLGSLLVEPFGQAAGEGGND